jgi:glycine/D-amino acid oxidase-like deaminating enzyme
MRHTAHGWWLEEAGPVEAVPPLEGDLDVDVAIVGGGYTGMWTAWHLLATEPGAKVALLEADVCGHGPSGRNGGFCETLWVALPRLRELLGDADAVTVADASADSVREIGEFCESEGVDAWYRHAPYMLASTAPGTDAKWRAIAAAAREVGRPEQVREVGAEELRSRCDSPAFREGIVLDDSASVQPARLGLGLRARLIARGARLFEHTRVRGLRTAGRREATLDAEGGRVRAKAVVLAIGPSSRALRPLRSRLSVTSSHIILTEPVPDVIEELGWTGGESITDGRVLVHYFRTTRDGRIAFGWGGGRPVAGARTNGRAEVDGSVVGDLRAALVRLFPQLAGRELTHAWGGPIDVSPSHVPQVGTLPDDRVQFAFGYTGNGVGPTHLVGKTMAARALDRRDDASRIPLPDAPGAWVPPEPFAVAGGRLVRRALVRADHLAEEGRTPDPLTRGVAALPHLLGMHVGR